RAGEYHLQRDQPVEPQVPGPKDDPHAAAAEHCFDLVAGDLRQGRPFGWQRGRLVGRREEGVEGGPGTTEPSPAVADHGQQLGARTADLFRRGLRLEEFVEQLLDSWVVGHEAGSPSAGVGSGRGRILLGWVQIPSSPESKFLVRVHRAYWE